MCGRVETHDPAPIEGYMEYLGVTRRPEIRERYNVAPTQSVPVVYSDGAWLGDSMRWGLTPRFWKPGANPPPLFNARDDRIWKAPNYKGLIGRQHCVVLVNGFYEWEKIAGRKQPWHITSVSGPVLAMAGIWQQSKSGELECSIITTSANEMMSKLHARMPVILDEPTARTWLEVPPKEHIEALLAPCPEDWLQMRSVSTYVNNSRNEGPECLTSFSQALK